MLLLFAYFALVDAEGTVKNVIVADREFVEKHPVKDMTWVETSMDGSVKKNYAEIGGKYDKNRDAFIQRKPFNSWVINEESAKWVAPIEKPRDGKDYEWDESIRGWKAERSKKIIR